MTVYQRQNCEKNLKKTQLATAYVWFAEPLMGYFDQLKQSPNNSVHSFVYKCFNGVGWDLEFCLSSPSTSVFLLGQDIAPLAAPDHQGDHGQSEENWNEDEDG